MTIGPKKHGPQLPPDEGVNEPSTLIDKEAADIEGDNPIEHDAPVEQAGEEGVTPPTFEE